MFIESKIILKDCFVKMYEIIKSCLSKRNKIMFYFIYQMDYLNLLFHALLKLIVYLLSSKLKLAQNKKNDKTNK